MLDNKNIWQDNFNLRSLENEDWLDPSDGVLQTIEEKIYPEEKRKVFPFLWVGFGVILIASLVLLKLYLGDNSNKLNSEIDRGSNTELGQSAFSNSKEELEPNKVSDKQEEVIEFNLAQQKKSREGNEKVKIADPIINVFNSNQLSQKKTFIEKNSAKGFATGNSIDSKVRASNNLVGMNQLVSASTFIPSTPLTSISSKEVIKKDLVSTFNLVPISQTQSLVNNFEPFELAFDSYAEIKPRSKKKNSVLFSAGMSTWMFKLNQNYETALEPADFDHTNGYGYFLNLGYGFKLDDKLSLRIRMDYENITSTSGHNSTVEYDTKLEQDNIPTNEIDLVMASPLGFMETNVVLNRSSGTSMTNTALTLDLNNEHHIHNLDLSIDLNYDFKPYAQWRPAISVGTGLNYLTKVKNALASYSTDHPNFNSSPSNPVSTQENITQLRTYVQLGLALETDLNPNIAIGLRTNIKSDLKAIHKLDDFSTGLNRFQFGLYLRKNL